MLPQHDECPGPQAQMSKRGQPPNMSRDGRSSCKAAVGKKEKFNVSTLVKYSIRGLGGTYTALEEWLPCASGQRVRGGRATLIRTVIIFTGIAVP